MRASATRPHREALVRWAKHRSEALVLSADLTASCEADGFREAYPQRFFSLGMAEQNMMSFAGGLAREGLLPLVHTFAVFITRRPFDQVAMSIGYPNLSVRLLGFLPGISTPGGVTHQAIDDLALMRAIPNMTVLECGDATEVESLLPAIEAVRGPVYVRVLRGEVTRLFPADEPMVLGRARVLCRGKELTLISSGHCTEQAIDASTWLQAQGVSVTHLHVSTLKPFNDPQLLAAIEASRHGVITVENHLCSGGLGSAVAELMAGAGVGLRLRRLGLRDCYAHGASTPFLMRSYEMDTAAIIKTAGDLLGRSLEYEQRDLIPLRAERSASKAKAEDL